MLAITETTKPGGYTITATGHDIGGTTTGTITLDWPKLVATLRGTYRLPIRKITPSGSAWSDNYHLTWQKAA